LPLYEYKCKKCGRVTEKIRKFSDPPLTVCESCRGKLEQLISSPAIQFKGAGWYVTDYAKKSSAPSNSSEGSSSSSEKSEKSDGSSSSSENSEKKESKAAKSEGKSEAKESKKASEPAKASSKKD
jgi:putative FmdB family regulatory protein